MIKKLNTQEKIDKIQYLLAANTSLKDIAAELQYKEVRYLTKFMQNHNIKKGSSVAAPAPATPTPAALASKDSINIELDTKDLEDIQQILKLYRAGKLQVIEATPTAGSKALVIDPVKEDIIVNTTIRVQNSILQAFKSFCSNNKQYKTQDLYSKALKEFLDKYN